jgi:uncharacterized protein (TIGR00251 family)
MTGVFIMVFTVKVIPGAKKNLYKDENGQVKVYLTTPPVDGRANDALCGFLAEHFGVRPSSVEIIKGLKSRHKVININGI